MNFTGILTDVFFMLVLIQIFFILLLVAFILLEVRTCGPGKGEKAVG